MNAKQRPNVVDIEGKSMHLNFCVIYGCYTEEAKDGVWSPTAAFTAITGSANDDKREKEEGGLL